tara:strand:+ start:448 stop:675 length:228 start_codon:yes stop_codon:yes gene_type:complete
MKFLFYLFIFYILFRLVSRLFLFYLKSKINSRNYNFQQEKKMKKEGDVSVDKVSKKNKQSSEKLGEYVDYEEIDE